MSRPSHTILLGKQVSWKHEVNSHCRISGTMTGALVVYSATFMRYSLAVTPKNYLLFLCHFVNEGAQLTQGYRWMQYHKLGGKERMEKEQSVLGKLSEEAKNAVEKVKDVGK
jgi:mitochondrial pyruvate carrier 1